MQQNRKNNHKLKLTNINPSNSAIEQVLQKVQLKLNKTYKSKQQQIITWYTNLIDKFIGSQPKYQFKSQQITIIQKNNQLHNRNNIIKKHFKNKVHFSQNLEIKNNYIPQQKINIANKKQQLLNNEKIYKFIPVTNINVSSNNIDQIHTKMNQDKINGSYSVNQLNNKQLTKQYLKLPFNPTQIKYSYNDVKIIKQKIILRNRKVNNFKVKSLSTSIRQPSIKINKIRSASTNLKTNKHENEQIDCKRNRIYRNIKKVNFCLDNKKQNTHHNKLIISQNKKQIIVNIPQKDNKSVLKIHNHRKFRQIFYNKPS